jgi:hypothetical protein
MMWHARSPPSTSATTSTSKCESPRVHNAVPGTSMYGTLASGHLLGVRGITRALHYLGSLRSATNSASVNCRTGTLRRRAVVMRPALPGAAVGTAVSAAWRAPLVSCVS